MTKNDICRLQDSLAKLDKKHRLNKGGSQFTSEVALGPSSIMKGMAMLRNQNVRELPKMDIASMQRRMGA